MSKVARKSSLYVHKYSLLQTLLWSSAKKRSNYKNKLISSSITNINLHSLILMVSDSNIYKMVLSNPVPGVLLHPFSINVPVGGVNTKYSYTTQKRKSQSHNLWPWANDGVVIRYSVLPPPPLLIFLAILPPQWLCDGDVLVNGETCGVNKNWHIIINYIPR